MSGAGLTHIMEKNARLTPPSQLQFGRLHPFCIDLQINRTFGVGAGADYYGQLAGEEVHVRAMEQFKRARVAGNGFYGIVSYSIG